MNRTDVEEITFRCPIDGTMALVRQPEFEVLITNHWASVSVNGCACGTKHDITLASAERARANNDGAAEGSLQH